MHGDPWKNAAQWLYGKLFREEPLRPRPQAPKEKLPPLPEAARSLENTPGKPWQSREAVFLKQARLLENYEDNCPFTGSVVYYFPTYQSLSDRELRGYFTWRTRLRRGQIEKTCRTFAFLYIYELLHCIGVPDPAAGYEALLAFRRDYAPLDAFILPYLNRWTTDFVVYYDLPPALLADFPRVRQDKAITCLENGEHLPPEAVMGAVEALAPGWISRSRFCRDHREDFSRVLAGLLKGMARHYAERTQKPLAEQLFGRLQWEPVRLFENAVFASPRKTRDLECTVDERFRYRCENGLWSLLRHPNIAGGIRQLDRLEKTVDGYLREALGDKHPIKYAPLSKWQMKLLQEETAKLLSEKEAAQKAKITIDYSQLDRIRREAAITRDKLTVEEELEEAPEAPEPEVPETPDTPLSLPEYRLLQSLLYDRPTDWVRSEGYLMSVLVDGINEKLYDTFCDTVVEDTPAVIEDYIDDLKEMVAP